MKSRNKAFSLTELLIVLVVVALLFAALAPIVTKRHVAENHASENIWNFIPGDAERDVFFDPGNPEWSSSVFIGEVADSSNHGKLVINSNDITYNDKTYKQPQIQFRFSAEPQQQGRGLNTANLYVSDSNVVFGPSLVTSNDKLDKTTIYGLSTLKSPQNARGLTVLGNNTLGNAKILNKKYNYIIAAGNRAAYSSLELEENANAINGIYIGANAGAGLSGNEATDNIAIGYNSSNKNGFLGSGNVFLGAYTGNGFNTTDSNYNSIVGSVFYGKKAAYNTIIGYGAYEKGNPDIKNLTAIGYGACNSINTDTSDGSRICIGYKSGYSTNYTPQSFDTDKGEHIFLGGEPKPYKVNNTTTTKAFSGRSVLEVHNVPDNNGKNRGYVVLNSNLVVRGNFFPSDNDTNGNNNYKVTYNTFETTMEANFEDKYYRCIKDSLISDSVNENINGKYACKEMGDANPKSINMLKRENNCSTSDGYPSGTDNICPKIKTSDVRLKNIISENTDGIDKLVKLNPYNYTYKNDDKTPQVGVIAQDLQKVFPNSVSKDSQGFLKIRWDEMFYSLINSIKSLAAKVEDLFTKVTKMESDILKLHKDQSDIKTQISVINKRVKKLERE